MRQTPKNVSPFSNQARNAYVIEHITDSLLKLLRDKHIGDISISELCDLAGIGRASFYRNFESKEDILRGYINKIFKEWMNEADGKENRPLSELLGLLFVHFEKHRNFYSLLNERNLVHLLKDVIIGLCGPKPEHSKVEAYAKAYVAYTLYGWIEVWFQRGMHESAEEIIEMFKGQGL
ncbi:TetR/AcrR family transcriptional regulator [Candidatus Arthromitus sp. SFB-rat-Yit]|uniref:TetR/AcrR family transcriptional regulator n=1 Tax=Candidatus Arthromitus sp. SFB-rat-Yit TaxID=1041504 RepID=UPI000227A627|nr:TetR/AcrR family transcriptional regulator [Candidatus Arthromitus sp. SFB-rat-Yit]BAK80581.1 transcriptional regulator, TetR family [Candidatus Arthromitus sp. SFB-rat-Yit]